MVKLRIEKKYYTLGHSNQYLPTSFKIPTATTLSSNKTVSTVTINHNLHNLEQRNITLRLDNKSISQSRKQQNLCEEKKHKQKPQLYGR